MDNDASRAFRTALGFYPTSKDSAEFAIFMSVYDRARAFAHTRGLHAGNARACHHDMAQYAYDESLPLFEYAKAYPQFYSLLPTPQACQSFVFTVLLARIAEESAVHDKKRRKGKF